jgi:hypothetical protein
MGESISGNVTSAESPADICNKVVPGGQKRNHLTPILLHDLCDWILCLIILLSEEVCGSWGFPFCMAN